MLDLDLDEFSGNYIQYPLNPVSNPGINGNIIFFELIDGNTKAVVNLINTVDGETYPIHIHENSVSTGGAILKTLNSVNGTTGRSVTFINSLDDNTLLTFLDIVAFNGHINVHLNNLSTKIVTGDIGISINVLTQHDNGETEPPTAFSGNIRIVALDPVLHQITLKNFDSSTIDISGLRVSSEFRYETISNLPLINGSFSLTGNGTVTFEWLLTDEDADLSLYVPTGIFSDALNMLDFMQWGSAGNGRESVAVVKGIWTQGDFILGPGPYNYTGDGLQNGLSFW